MWQHWQGAEADRRVLERCLLPAVSSDFPSTTAERLERQCGFSEMGRYSCSVRLIVEAKALGQKGGPGYKERSSTSLTYG